MTEDSLSPLLGPTREHIAAGLVLERAPGRITLRAERDLDGLATGRFDEPASYFAWRPETAEGADAVRFGGYSCTQFALPVSAGSDLDFPFQHGKTLISPRVVFPLYASHPDHGATLIAPLDQFHEQVLAVIEGELRWGWHGDLDSVPAGFSTTVGVYHGDSIRTLLDAWGASVRAAGVPAADRYADVSTSHLSYWTDNGAAYWYRREPGRDLSSTLEAKCDELRAAGVPFRAFELDSWFYPHERSRPVEEVGYLDTVPPTGMLRWEPREDVLPEGIPRLRERLGDPPLILHSRHVSAQSPYVDAEDWWVHHGVAHPKDPAFFERWMRDAASWGACCYEQDWLWVIFFAMAQLRAAPGRARAWQKGLDDAADAHGLSLIWCMAIPADFLEATRLRRMVAIRTCDDYRFADDPAFLWNWFLVVNALAGALELWPFKDVFFSHEGDGIDGDPYPEVEALLSALSAGPVGLGDRIGRTDPEVVGRTCRADGLLVKPDRPLAALDGCLSGEPLRGERLLWAEAGSGTARYLVALHAAESDRPIEDGLDLGGEWLVYDWRSGDARPATRIDLRLDHRDWRLYVLCPIEDGAALIGDPARFATLGDRRIERASASRARVVGVPGERVTVRFWTARAGLADVEVEVPASGAIDVARP